ncbi:multisubunit Na+/H+ antiporter MnhE subunit [Bradyrhizobium sp. JR6.1]
MQLTREDLVVGVTIPGFFVLSTASMIACGHAFPAMHVWRSGITAEAILGTAVMAVFIPAFIAGRFSFGYLVSFALLSAVFGFVWLSFFSAFDYPHAIARWAMIAALAAAMIPLMFQNMPVWRPGLSETAIKRIALLLLASSLAVLVADISYGANLGNPYGAARNAVTRPALLNYLTGIMIGAVLPYLFAHFASRRQWVQAACVLLFALCFYPVVNNKTVLLLPIWLPFLFWLFGRFTPRPATVLAFLIPMIIGLTAFAVLGRRQGLRRVQRHQSALPRNPVARP